MTSDLKRLQAKMIKKQMGDGPLERQLLLLKLSHALETHPDFGDKYIGDFRSPQQKWIAEVSALLKRISFSHELNCKASCSTLVQYWKPSIDQLCQLVLRTIEEIRLELELDSKEEIGQIYNAGEVYDLYADLKNIIGKAEKGVLVVDAYFSADAFTGYLSGLEPNVSVRILAEKYSADLQTAIRLHETQFKSSIELRRSKAIHDRVVIIDSDSPWIIGASIKDAGKKATYILPVPPHLAEKKTQVYEDIWASAKLL